MPFREAHHVVGRIVGEALASGKPLTSIALDCFQRHSSLFQADVMKLLSLQRSLELRNIAGGTGPVSVSQQLQSARSLMERGG